jgi:hypothetical protein
VLQALPSRLHLCVMASACPRRATRRGKRVGPRRWRACWVRAGTHRPAPATAPVSPRRAWRPILRVPLGWPLAPRRGCAYSMVQHGGAGLDLDAVGEVDVVLPGEVFFLQDDHVEHRPAPAPHQASLPQGAVAGAPPLFQPRRPFFRVSGLALAPRCSSRPPDWHQSNAHRIG